MAQNVTIAGVTFSDVPSVESAKSGGGSALFVDPTPTTATAADVASGKYFFNASGTLTAGTASGGGGGAIIPGALRPDAELVQSWTYDKLAVADLGLTLPEYSTSRTNIVNGGTLATVTPDHANYFYLLTSEHLIWPIYTSNARANAKPVYFYRVQTKESCIYPPGTFVAPDGTSNNATRTSGTVSGSDAVYVYYTSSALAHYSTGGVMTASTSDTITESAIKIYTPYFYVQGSTTYFNSAAWAQMTDLRMQYAIRLYRLPRTATTPGFCVTSLAHRAVSVANVLGTLA